MTDHLVLTLTSRCVRGQSSSGRTGSEDRRDPAAVARLVCALLPSGGTVEVLDDNTPLVGPTVHLNGTGGRELLLEAEEVVDTLRIARKALCDLTLHMRDYYVLPSGGEAELGAQRNRWADQVEALERMLEEAEEYAAGISAQVALRRRV